MAHIIGAEPRWNESGIAGAGPALWYGPGAPAGADDGWPRTPVGSIYIHKPNDSAAAAYLKTANNGTSADWVSVTNTEPTAAVFNVLDYGAVGDGETSDQTAFGLAFAAASAGDTIRIPGPHSYYIATGNLTVQDGVTIAGDGATIIVDSGRRCFTLGSNTKVVGLKFHGSDDAGASVTTRFIQVMSETNVYIADCEFDSLANRAIAICGSTHVTVENCRFTNARQELGNCCISIQCDDTPVAASSHVSVRNCTFINADFASGGVAGLIIVGNYANDLQVHYVLIEGCYFEHMGRDYTIVGESAPGPRGDVDVYNDAEHIKIVNCTSVGSALGLTKQSDVCDSIIANNTVIGSQYQGIEVTSRYAALATTLPRQIQIRGNYLYNCGTAGLDGIDVFGKPTDEPAYYIRDVIISDNIIDTTGRYGIQATEILGAIISRNTIRNSAITGIYAMNATAISTVCPMVVTDNAVDMAGVSANGIAVRPHDASATTSGATVIRGNSVGNVAGNPGIAVYNTNYAAVGDNVFHGVPAGQEYALTGVTLRAGSVNGAAITHVAGTVTLVPGASNILNSAAGAITATLPDGQYDGQICSVRMSDATNVSTVSVTHHRTSDPEVFTFDGTADFIILYWNLNMWITFVASAAV